MQMKIKIIYFGIISEKVKQNSEELFFVGTVWELRRQLNVKYPEISGLIFSVSVNKKIVPDSYQISEADEVALLPPFSGG